LPFVSLGGPAVSGVGVDRSDADRIDSLLG
jgi:hypothetical protein